MTRWLAREVKELVDHAKSIENCKIFGCMVKEGERFKGQKDTKHDAGLRVASQLWKVKFSEGNLAARQQMVQRVLAKASTMIAVYHNTLKAFNLAEGALESVEAKVWEQACENCEYFADIHWIRHGYIPEMIQESGNVNSHQTANHSTSLSTDQSTSHLANHSSSRSINKSSGSYPTHNVRSKRKLQVQSPVQSHTASPEPPVRSVKAKEKARPVEEPETTTEVPDPEDQEASDEMFVCNVDNLEDHVVEPSEDDLNVVEENQGAEEGELVGDPVHQESGDQGEIFTHDEVKNMTIDQRLKLTELYLNEKNVLLAEAGTFQYTVDKFQCDSQDLKRKYHQLPLKPYSIPSQGEYPLANEDGPVVGSSSKKRTRFSGS